LAIARIYSTFPPIQRCTVSSPVSKPTSHSFHWVTALKSTVNPSYCQRTPHLVVSCTYPAPKTTCRRIRKKGYQLAGLSNTRSIRRWFSSSSGGGRDTCMRASAQAHTARTTRPEIKQSAWLHAVAAGSLHLDLLRVWSRRMLDVMYLCIHVRRPAYEYVTTTSVCVPTVTKRWPPPIATRTRTDWRWMDSFMYCPPSSNACMRRAVSQLSSLLDLFGRSSFNSRKSINFLELDGYL